MLSVQGSVWDEGGTVDGVHVADVVGVSTIVISGCLTR